MGKPIVACELGRLYNKEAIIEKLLNHKSEGTDGNDDKDNVAGHIRSLKDVKELMLSPNPAFKGDKATVGDGGYVDRLVAPYICPLTGQEMNGRSPFVFDWSNGKVVSKKAYKMLKDDEAAAIAEVNLIILNPEESDEDMVTKMEGRRARAKAAKKAAKEEKRKLKDVSSDGAESAKKAKVVENGKKKSSKSDSVNGKAGPSSSKNSFSNVKSSINKGILDKKGMARSVQNDDTKSEVYKSLFSTHSSAINKPKGNWVTFDPRYN